MRRAAKQAVVPPRNRLLVVDDDRDVAALFGHVGARLGFDARLLNDPAAFERAFLDYQPTLLLLDLQMPGRDGIELLRALPALGGRARVLIASGLDKRTLTTAEQLGASIGVDIAGSFCKPIAPEELEALLREHKTQERILTADRLARALERDELRVQYQPKATLRRAGVWTVDGAEALVRWDHPEYGVLEAKDFIDVAEHGGLMSALTDFVLHTALAQARDWLDRGLALEIGLNVSTRILGDIEFPDRLLAAVRENGLAASAIVLELTETAAMQDGGEVLDVLARLAVKGVGLCLDDFGTGYSSLTQLYRMPYSELKLDNTFIADMRYSEEAQCLVEGLVDLAHKLKIRTCAEGVEDRPTLDLLERLGCDRAQGHLIGAAMHPAQLEGLAAERNGLETQDRLPHAV